jgi:VanZ family protein
MNTLSRRWPLAAALLLIALATLVPLGAAPPRLTWHFEWSDFLVNLCLYLPLGALLTREEVRPTRIALLALLLSGSVELLQATAIAGRRGSPADVLSNVAGALAGFGLFRAALRVRDSRGRTGYAAAIALAALPVVFWLVSGALLAPWPPGIRDWYGQWAHHFEGTEPFHGSLLAVDFLGRPIPDHWLGPNEAWIAAARRGPLSLDVTLLSGGTTEGITHLASVANGEGGFVIGLSQVGDDLFLAWWSRGTALGLRFPQLGLPGAVRAPKGERLTIHAAVTATRASVSVQRDSDIQSFSRRLTPFTGWRTLLPSRELSPEAQRLLDVVWTLALAGYLLFALRILRALRPARQGPFGASR